MESWHERDAFWREIWPALFTKRRWEQAENQVQQLLELLDLRAGAAVLDLPCGPGRHSLQLARQGFAVTGVDRTAAYLAEARDRAETEGLAVEWVQADMREFRRPGAFDVAINMFTSFGYFEDPADDRRVAENFLASLKPGGRLLMELFGKEALASGFCPRDWLELEDGSLFLEERTVIDAWRKLKTRTILLREGKRYEHELTLRQFSAAELIDLLLEAGFSSAVAYGSLEGIPYDQDASRLVVIATK